MRGAYGRAVLAIVALALGSLPGNLHAEAPRSTAPSKSAFERGMRLYRQGDFEEALEAFESACDEHPEKAFYHYYRALTFFELDDLDAAEDAVIDAVGAEREHPLATWGKTMQRVQGPARTWLEKARKRASRSI